MSGQWTLYYFRKEGRPYGHVALGHENTGTYISFYPECSCQKLCSCIPGGVIGCGGCCDRFHDCAEEEKHYDSMKSEVIFDLNTEEIVGWWNKFKACKPKFHIINKNCSVVVHKALCRGNSWFQGSNANRPDKVLALVDDYNKYRQQTGAI